MFAAQGRQSDRQARRSEANLHGTSGVRVTRGQLLVNGASSGLVELTLDPPCRTPRTMNTMFVKETVREILVSLIDPDAFIDAITGKRQHPDEAAG